MGSEGVVPPWYLQLAPLLLVAIIFTIRMIRPQRISVTRMWLSPIILGGIGAWSIYVTETINPAPPWEIAVGLAVGFAAGVPFGILRGMHTDVRPTDKPGVMYLGSNWVTACIFIGAFGLRFAVRMLMPHRGSLATVIGDGLLAFAIAYIATSYVAIYRKYEAEVAGAVPPVS